MRKIYLFLVFTLLFFISSGIAQTTADFENLDVDSTGYWNGSDLSGGFTSGNAFFVNSYNQDWGSWSGWAYSNWTDTITSGWDNQYAAKTGSGVEGSTNYAVFYREGIIKLTGEAAGGGVEGFYITNSTYAYNSMRDGDAFAKKFGGETGEDPDFFKVTIQKYEGGELKDDTVVVYLADYRFDDNSDDYILDQWQWVDLTSLGNVDSLKFSLSSSDNGDFGMNTPAYFCLDNLVTHDGAVGIEALNSMTKVRLFPNPAVDFIRIDMGKRMESPVLVQIYDLLGNKILEQTYGESEMEIDVHNLEKQQYIIRGVNRENGKTLFSKWFVKM